MTPTTTTPVGDLLAGLLGRRASDGTVPGRLQVVDGWWQLSRPRSDDGQPEAGPGSPGLWRAVPADDDGAGRLLFELPPSVVRTTDEDDERHDALVRWAADTAGGELSADWSSPEPQDVADWIDASSLSVRHGAQIVTGRLIHDDRRLAVRFALGPLPVAGTRRRWLERCVVDAARTWRLVRVGTAPTTGEGADGHDGQELVAEVDLSGAPHSALPSLLAAAAQSLRWWVCWSLPAVSLLGDKSLRSTVLDSDPSAFVPRP